MRSITEFEFSEFVARGKSVRDQIARCGFQNLVGIAVGFEDQLESGRGSEMCEICEVLFLGRDYVEF